jgi:hypothetical protein
MLGFTGVGSYISSFFPERLLGPAICASAGVVVVAQFLAWLIMPHLIEVFQGYSLPVKLAVLSPLLAVVATPMGVLFPSGLRLQERHGLDITCWVWGMNGVGAVVGSVGSTAISLNFGIRATFVAGMVVYGVVLLVSAFFLADRARARAADIP